MWDFAFLGEVEPDDVDVSAIRFNDVMATPGCFDASPAYAGKRGLAAYRLHVPAAGGARQRLVFDAVHHWCRVFVNGRALGDHIGGFTRFSFDFDRPAEDEIEITVLVDNRFDHDRCPLHLDYYDWYHYGGLARGVELQGLGPVWIDGLRVATEDLDVRRLSLTIRCAAARKIEAPLVVTFDGQVVLQESVTLDPGPAEIARTLEFPGAALWSPEEPNLHLLHVRLGDDDLRKRVGIRQVAVDGQRLLLNGQPIRLIGVNRHESHVQIGHGLPDALLVADAQLVHDLGCNFVRGSHYPQDVRWLDLCDEMGFLVWSEVLGWQNTAKHLTDERFMQAQMTNLREMVDVACTHPSVIIYGVLNESRSDDPACRPGYQALLNELRRLDPSRLLSYTCTCPETDGCLDLVDVVAVDAYPGWYEGTAEEIPAILDEVARTIDSRGFADKPLMMAEIGAGAIWGWRDWNARHWSEQYQAELLDRSLRHLLFDSDRWCGVGVWQLCDIRSSEQTYRALCRPRSFNNKGLVDEYRRPKLAYDLVKRHFHTARAS